MGRMLGLMPETIGSATKSWTGYTQKRRKGMYSEEEYRKAPEVYEETKSG
jgi:hypothetical protein